MNSFHFHEHIREYNGVFCFTSLGGKVDKNLNRGDAPYIYSIGGQIFHRIGSLLPPEGNVPLFAQLYMVDSANEVEHRMNSFTTDANSNPLRPQIVKDLKDMFDEHNVLAKIFRSARDRVNLGNVQSVKIKLMARRTSDGREYDLPTVDEQAGLIVDETGEDTFQPDIVVQYLTNAMERVKYTHSSLMALQYPILFPYGEDEWHGNIQLRNSNSSYGDADIEIPADLIIDNKVDPVIAIVEETYTQLSDNIGNADYFAGRAILAPFHETVSQINNYMLDQFPGEEMCYYNYDSIQSDCVNSSTAEDEFPLEFLNSLQIGNFPDHQLKLKVGVPVILLRNLDQTTGLCNGTRMVIRTLGTWFIEVEILMGTHVGERVYLPRLSLTSKQKSLDFTLVRRQYPIALSFAMTINKSQGQTLHSVGLCLKRQVFTHGQLYVALSRVTRKSGLKIIISCNEVGEPIKSMKNIVFHEVLKD
ncbi:ATP-dependent DNA helicase PIF1 [Linum perenne]